MELKNEHLTRQLDVIPLNCLNRQITIIGAGAVGSYSAFALAKMGFNNITIYDFDEVDIVNLNAQIYRFSDIGKSKVEALKDIIKDFTGIDLQIKNERYENQVFKDIVIMAVDNMKTRKEIYQNHKMRGIMTNFLIDPRMAIEYAYIQAFNPMSPKEQASYELTLFDDDNSVQERCTGKSTVYTAQLIGATIAKMVKDIATDKSNIKRISWDIAGNVEPEISLNIL